jgi:hypothetical protein
MTCLNLIGCIRFNTLRFPIKVNFKQRSRSLDKQIRAIVIMVKQLIAKYITRKVKSAYFSTLFAINIRL